MSGYIYVIHTRACINSGEHIFKVGKTINYDKRLTGYDKGSKYKLIMQVDNIHTSEKRLLKICKKIFVHSKDYGSEYFACNIYYLLAILKNMPENIKIIYENYSISNEILTHSTLNQINNNKHSINVFIMQHYNIICSILIHIKKDKIDCINDKLKTFKSSKVNKRMLAAQAPIFEIDISKEIYEQLNKRSFKTLNETEKQQRYIFEIAVHLYKIPIERVNQKFVEKYIGHYSQISINIELLFTFYRFIDLSVNLDENISLYNKLKDKTRINKLLYYNKLIEGQKLLNIVNSNKIEKQKRIDFNTNIDKYINSLTNDDYEKIKKLYKLDHHSNNPIKNELHQKHKLYICKTILRKCFNIEIYRKNNHSETLYYNFSNWQVLLELQQK